MDTEEIQHTTMMMMIHFVLGELRRREINLNLRFQISNMDSNVYMSIIMIIIIAYFNIDINV